MLEEGEEEDTDEIKLRKIELSMAFVKLLSRDFFLKILFFNVLHVDEPVFIYAFFQAG